MSAARRGRALALAGALALACAVPAAAQWYEPSADPALPRVRYGRESGLLSLNDRCMVKRNKLSIEVRPVWVNGRPASFCCTGCVEVFGVAPETFLPAHGITLPCPVRPSRRAVLDAAHRARVNWEIYFFSSVEARRRFEREPLRWCGTLTDPVTGTRFTPRADSPRTTFRDRPYFFSADSSRARFLDSPERFADRRGA